MEAPPSNPASFVLADYGGLLRRRWHVLVLGIVVGALLAVGYLLLGPKTYTSEVSVLVRPTGVEQMDQVNVTNGRTDSELNLDTEAQLVQSAAVASGAKRLLNTPTSTSDLAEQVAVTVPPNTSVLTIAFDAPTAADAQRGAQAFARAYLDNREATARAQLDRQAQSVQNQIEDLQNKLERITDELATLTPGSPNHSYAESQRRVLVEQISDLNRELSPLLAADVSPGQIITNAQLPASPNTPFILYLASGMMAGLLVGLGVAVLLERFDQRIRRAEDVERLLGLPVLVEIPRGRGTPELLSPRTRTGQAFHELANFLTATLGNGNHVVVVTGASAGVGTGMVAANLAAALARMESSVLLVCANMRSATSARLLGCQYGPGLAELLLHNVVPEQVAQSPTLLPRLRVIVPGANSIEAAMDELQTDAMEKLVEELRREFRYVVIEAPSTSVTADAQALADVADGSLVVVELARTRRDEVLEGVRQLDRMRTAVLGGVVIQPLDEVRGPARGSAERRQPDAAGDRTAPLPKLFGSRESGRGAGRDGGDSGSGALVRR
ncbi:MAG: lipopolysaccharide biosynthesis protein [Streptosporangiales bacterium]|nr:lipopolysaccharide biosynthesis protein [Streptosporangiales bacterium]